MLRSNSAPTSYIMDISQISDLIGKVLLRADLYSDNAHALILSTGAQESHYKYITQLGDGPAKSFWQIEPATAYDNFSNYLNFRAGLKNKVLNACSISPPDFDQVIKAGMVFAELSLGDIMGYNMAFAILMARIRYYRVPDPIPATINGQAGYWKKYYNTVYGAGTIGEFKSNYKEFKLYNYCSVKS